MIFMINNTKQQAKCITNSNKNKIEQKQNQNSNRQHQVIGITMI